MSRGVEVASAFINLRQLFGGDIKMAAESYVNALAEYAREKIISTEDIVRTISKIKKSEDFNSLEDVLRDVLNKYSEINVEDFGNKVNSQVTLSEQKRVKKESKAREKHNKKIDGLITKIDEIIDTADGSGLLAAEQEWKDVQKRYGDLVDQYAKDGGSGAMFEQFNAFLEEIKKDYVISTSVIADEKARTTEGQQRQKEVEDFFVRTELVAELSNKNKERWQEYFNALVRYCTAVKIFPDNEKALVPLKGRLEKMQNHQEAQKEIVAFLIAYPEVDLKKWWGYFKKKRWREALKNKREKTPKKPIVSEAGTTRFDRMLPPHVESTEPVKDVEAGERMAVVEAFMAQPEIGVIERWFPFYMAIDSYWKYKNPEALSNKQQLEKLGKDCQDIDIGLDQHNANDVEKGEAYRKVLTAFLVEHPLIDLEYITTEVVHHIRAAKVDKNALVKTVGGRLSVQSPEEVIPVTTGDIVLETATPDKQSTVEGVSSEVVTEKVALPKEVDVTVITREKEEAATDKVMIPEDAPTVVVDKNEVDSEPQPDLKPGLEPKQKPEPEKIEKKPLTTESNKSREKLTKAEEAISLFKESSDQIGRKLQSIKDGLGKYTTDPQFERIRGLYVVQLKLLKEKVDAQPTPPLKHIELYRDALNNITKWIERVEKETEGLILNKVNKEMPGLQQKWEAVVKKYGDTLTQLIPEHFPLSTELYSMPLNNFTVKQYFDKKIKIAQRVVGSERVPVAEKLYEEAENMQKELIMLLENKHSSVKVSSGTIVNQVVDAIYYTTMDVGKTIGSWARRIIYK
jgi:hypothetical protein